MDTQEKNEIRAINIKMVQKKVPYCRSQIYAEIEAGRFPRPIKLGRRSIAWLESEIDAWILSRPRAQIKPA